MFARRPRMNRRGIGIIATSGSAPAPSNPSTIVTSQTIVDWWRADLGVTVATGVTAWAGQVNGVTMTQGGGSTLEPALNASGGPNSTAVITGDGTDDFIVSNWNPPAPGTTPFFIWAIVSQVSVVNGDIFMGGNSSTLIAFTQATGPVVRLNNGVASTNLAAEVGSFARLEGLLTDTTSDRLRYGANSTSGTILGNGDATGFGLFARSTGILPANMAICEIAIWTGGDLTAGEIADLDAYATARYGGTLLV